MLPLRDDIPAKKFPIVNTWLIVINALCFAYEYQLGLGLQGFIMQHGFIPLRFFEQQQAAFFNPSRFVPVFASMFLHGSILHPSTDERSLPTNGGRPVSI